MYGARWRATVPACLHARVRSWGKGLDVVGQALELRPDDVEELALACFWNTLNRARRGSCTAELSPAASDLTQRLPRAEFPELGCWASTPLTLCSPYSSHSLVRSSSLSRRETAREPACVCLLFRDKLNMLRRAWLSVLFRRNTLRRELLSVPVRTPGCTRAAPTMLARRMVRRNTP